MPCNANFYSPFELRPLAEDLDPNELQGLLSKDVGLAAKLFITKDYFQREPPPCHFAIAPRRGIHLVNLINIKDGWGQHLVIQVRPGSQLSESLGSFGQYRKQSKTGPFSNKNENTTEDSPASQTVRSPGSSPATSNTHSISPKGSEGSSPIHLLPEPRCRSSSNRSS